MLQGTPIQTPDGPLPIEDLKRGDTVIGVQNGVPAPVTVESIFQVQTGYIYKISVNGTFLSLTAEHPVATADGVYRMASALKPGDTIMLLNQGRLQPGIVQSVHSGYTTVPAYNLLVSPAGTYIADAVVVHNKGCFLPETPIRLANGTEKPVSRIRGGDRVLAFTPDGAITQAVVQQILVRPAAEYCIVRTLDRVLHVTREHPFYIGAGTYKTIDALKPGDTIMVFDGTKLVKSRIESIETVVSRTTVYNLQTDKPNTYFANGAAVHNKGGGGGCFPAGTLIATPRGTVAIERLRAGDEVISIDRTRAPQTVTVRATHTSRSSLLILHTDRGSLTTTDDHPLACSSGKFIPAAGVTSEDAILTWDGRKTATARLIRSMSTRTSADVYTITVDRPHTFVAGGFVVHNKGGGGFRSSGSHHSSGSSGSSGSDGVALFVVFIIVTVIIVAVLHPRQRGKANLDHLYSPSDIAAKQDKTLNLISFIARQDPSVAPATLRSVAESTFRTLQSCWQAREYGPLKPLMMADLYKEHLSQIQGMIRNHEINMIDALTVSSIDLVNIRYAIKEEEREFTALITASAIDYYIDDRSRARLRGDRTASAFQEFWTFQYADKTWLLRDIEQTGESDILKEDNFFEHATDKAVDQISGSPEEAEGPAGPWLEKDVEAKDTRIIRLLNFLVKTDRLWSRKTMLLAARRAFLDLTAAWESGDPDAVPAALLFPELDDDLRKTIGANRDAGNKFEFRNLCIRKVELLLVRNYDDNRSDEFVARIRAHARKIVMNRGAEIHRDDDVTHFEQFLTFGRLDGQWKLKETVTGGDAEALAAVENIDQESSPLQLEWYYQHKRAS